MNRHSFSAVITIFITFTVLSFLCQDAQAQSSLDTVIRVSASTSTASPYITLNWTSISSASGNISIWRRIKGSTSWGSAITVSSSATTYPDTTAVPGIAYEYSLQCSRSVAPTLVYGAIVAGCNIPLVESRGKVILLVDSTMTASLSPEITQLQNNLAADGWIIYRHDVARQSILATSTNSTDYAPRLAELQAVRTIVQNDYNSAPGSDWSLLILGHIPVPYSGQTAPDGHGNHYGAWATDTYYADVNGTWTDTSVSTTDSNLIDARNYNHVGDGKFDQNTLPSNVELQCGRVDLSNMASVPNGMTEAELLRQYLMRNNLFRRNLPPYNTVARRGLIDDNFGYFYNEAFSSSGWRAGIGWLGYGSGKMDSLDWFGTLGTTPMLFAYGCGGGTLTSSSGIGYSVLDFNKKDSKAVFTMLFGSWFGDWDGTNNFLRSPLAGTANSLGLSCVWSGRGYFHLFHMALGETIGYSTRYTQNNNESTSSGGWPCNGYTRAITYNLMGDPTLRLHSIAPPTKVTATSTSSGITLNWIASTDTTLSGYHVYRSTSVSGSFTRITGVTATASNPTGSGLSTSTLTYTDTDSALVSGTSYTYLVKAVRMESSPSGTYANQSLGEAVTLTHLAATPAPAAPTRLNVTRTGTNSCTLTWDDNSSDETGFLIERRNPSGGAWSLLTTAAANATTYTDSSATVGQIVHYRVRATGAANSTYTYETADYNRAGLVRDTSYSYTTSKMVGTFGSAIARINGSAGSVSVNYTTASLNAVAGTDYTSTSGTLIWNHGETGTKSPVITIANRTGTQYTKIFKVTLNSPTNGLALNTPTVSYVFITDPAALTLPSPWVTTTIGKIISTDPGYAEYANGNFGLATCNASFYVDSTGADTDSLRFVYQTITGDFQITVRLYYLSATGTTVRAGIMVRGELADCPVMDSLFMSPSLSCLRYTRSTNSSTASTYSPTSYASSLPNWLRLTRAGTTFHVERSVDGVNWIAAADATPRTIANMPATAYVGIGVSTSDAAIPEASSKGYARFDNVTLYTVPATVATLTASTTGATQSGQIVLTWTASSAATSYLVERSTSSGSGFSQIGNSSTSSYTDTDLTAGTTYYYRVKAINPVYQASAYSPQASSTPYLAASAAGWNYTYFGSESSTGNAAPAADPDGDGIPNLLEYALGLNPTVANNATTLPSSQTQTIASDKFLTYTFVRNKNAADLTFSVEVSNDPATGWTSLDPLATVNQYSVSDNSPASGLQTITVKDSQPLSSSPRRFMRLKVSAP